MKDRLEQLLETYTLSEILIALDLEEVDVLAILEEQGYISNLPLPEPI